MIKGSNFIRLVVLSQTIYAIMLTLTFALKQTEGQVKALGIILIILGFIVILTSLLWGIVAYANPITCRKFSLKTRCNSKGHVAAESGWPSFFF